MHSKTPVLESLFNNVAGSVLDVRVLNMPIYLPTGCEIYLTGCLNCLRKIFTSHFLHKLCKLNLQIF